MLQITHVAGLGTLQMLQISWIQRKARGQACSTWGGTRGLAGLPMGTQEEQLMLMMLAPGLRKTLEKHKQRCKYC